MKEEFDVLIEMLAEIKQQNSEIKSQFSNRREASNSDSEKILEVQEAITAFAHVYGEHLKEHSKWEQELKDVAIKLGQRLTDIREEQADFNSQQTETLKTLSERVTAAQAPSITKKFYLLDAKRWIQWAIWGMLILLVGSFLGWNVYLHKINQSLNDYALRYRILRMEQSVSNNSFAQLDSIFETHSSEAQIKQLKERVTNYEAAVQRQAELFLRQQQLSAEQAQLQQQLDQ